MQTEIASGEIAITRAVDLLRAGGIVAIPTETVYGLAADALNPIAIAKIFEAKGRPKFDPLIVHLPERQWLQRLTWIPVAKEKLVFVLIERFWPGPLTIVLPRTEIVPGIVTAGLETVAVRRSAHTVFSEIIRRFGRPIAAPSANRFGRISPTTAFAVRDELEIPFIVDGGATTHGIESTVIRLAADRIEILRPGPVTAEMLSEFGVIKLVQPSDKISSPGQLPSHYAPRTKLILVKRLSEFVGPSNVKTGALAFDSGEGERYAAFRKLTEHGDLREAAANLFQMMRELDQSGIDLIVAELVPETGLGLAINDRLRRAASSR